MKKSTIILLVFLTSFYFIAGCSKRRIPTTPIINTQTYTATNLPTGTNTFTCTRTITQTPTYSFTLQDTFSATPTSTNTDTPEDTLTVIETVTETPTGTVILTDIGTPTLTLTSTSTITETISETITYTITSSYTASFTATNTLEDTLTETETITETSTVTETETSSATPTVTQTITETYTPTTTPTVTPTITETNTPNVTQTATAAAMQTEVAVLVSVPGGTYTQTDGTNSFSHTISTFKMGKYEVTYQLWYTVRTWAVVNGYTFANPGTEGRSGPIGAAPTTAQYEPVTTINWRDAIVWCNAYSQMTGLTSVYCSDAGFTTVIKDSTNGAICDSSYVNWAANGFKLPTEGEWQYAASYINGSSWTPWNYASGATADTNDVTATGLVAWYNVFGYITHDVGTKTANALGIYDMSGNATEWCFDWYGGYPGTSTDYRGPVSGSTRVMRGGSFFQDAYNLQVSNRAGSSPSYKDITIGFRVARTQ